jgi:hypothetical protein
MQRIRTQRTKKRTKRNPRAYREVHLALCGHGTGRAFEMPGLPFGQFRLNASGGARVVC